MTELAPPSSTDRLAPLPFAFAVLAVYLASFGSQMLLSPPVTARLSVWPFALAQAVLIIIWVWLHVQRLRDAGRGSGLAYGIAIVYALEIVLFSLLVWLIASSAGTTSGGAGREATILHLFVVLTLLGTITGDPTLSALQVWIAGFAVVMLLPVVIGVCFSLWAATRPRAPSRP